MQPADDRVSADRLALVIRDALAETRALEAALGDERQALEAEDTAALDASGDAKRGCLARLERLDGERRQLLGLAGHREDDDGMAALLGASPSGHPLHSLWAALRESAIRCRDANAVNGAIVQLRRQQIARALDVLRGGAESRPSVYGADGTQRGEAGRLVGSA